MPTAQSYINAALLRLGVIQPGETPNFSESADALTLLNQLLESWEAIKLLTYALDEVSFASGPVITFSDTAGAGIVTPRPLAISTIQHQITLANGDVIKDAVKLVGREEFAVESMNGERARIPRIAYYSAGFPQATLSFYPTLTAGLDIGIVSYWHRFTASGPVFATLSTSVNFPPAYQLAITLTLAAQLAPGYGRPMDGTLAQNAVNALSAVRGLNLPPTPGQAEVIQASGGAVPVPPDANLALPKA